MPNGRRYHPSVRRILGHYCLSCGEPIGPQDAAWIVDLDCGGHRGLLCPGCHLLDHLSRGEYGGCGHAKAE